MGGYHDLYVQCDTLLLADVFEKSRNTCIEIYGLNASYFLSLPGLSWQGCLKKTEVKLELLTDIHMLLMSEERIRGEIGQSVHRYAKANNKFMKDYNKNIEPSYLAYLDASNLYGWEMSQKLPVNDFKWENDLSKFNERFIRALKQALNHGLILKEVHRVIQFNQEAWSKPYIDMNTRLRKEAKSEFEKDFFKLTNKSVFEKTMENVRKHRDIKLVTTEEKRIKLVSEPNYHTTKHFSKNLLAIEMKKTKVKMNKPVYLGMSILDISKTLMYEFWYDYVKPKYKDKAKLCYMDTDSFVINIFTEDFFEDINNDVERWFDTSNYDENDKRPLPMGMNKKVIGMFKDELGGKIMKEFCALRAKTYAYLMDDDTEKKKAKWVKKCVVKRRLMFENYKDSLFNNKTILESQLRFKSDHQNVYT